MIRTLPSRLPLAAFLLAAAGLLAACGGDGDARQGDGLTGAVMADGSSTVFPITEAVAEEFMREHPGVRVTVGMSGTGGGFSKFLRNETDLSNASRPIKPSETTLAEQNAVGYIELPVAYDGLTVMTSPENDFAECLTVEELRRIWEPGSRVNNWSQVRPGFPDRRLNLYGAGTDSGTYDYFTEAILGEEGASRADFTASEDDNVLVQGIAGDPNSLGFFGMAYYEENADRLKLIAVDPGSGCVEPTVETVRTGTYQPLSRPVFVYVRADRAEDPAVRAFVEFYLENAATLAREVGYVPLSDEAYAMALERFRNGVTGSVFEGAGSTVGVRLEDLLARERGAAAPPDTAPPDTAAADTSAVL